jgi:hypothetical protein
MATVEDKAVEIVVAWLGGDEALKQLAKGLEGKDDEFVKVGKRIGEVYHEVLKAVRKPV